MEKEVRAPRRKRWEEGSVLPAPGPALQAALSSTLPGDGEVGDLDEKAGRREGSGKLRAANPVTNTL